MHASIHTSKDDQGDISAVAPAGPRVLDLAELLQVSGGAPRGGWEGDPLPGDSQATVAVPG